MSNEKGFVAVKVLTIAFRLSFLLISRALKNVKLLGYGVKQKRINHRGTEDTEVMRGKWTASNLCVLRASVVN
jgi:hypothetical protein